MTVATTCTLYIHWRQAGHCSPALKWAMHCQDTEWSYNGPIFRTPSLMTVWIGVLFCLLSPRLFIKWHHGDRTVHTRCIILLAPTLPRINKMFKVRLHSGLLTLDCQLPSIVSHTKQLAINTGPQLSAITIAYCDYQYLSVRKIF